MGKQNIPKEVYSSSRGTFNVQTHFLHVRLKYSLDIFTRSLYQNYKVQLEFPSCNLIIIIISSSSNILFSLLLTVWIKASNLYLQTHPPTLLQHTKRLILSLNLLHKEHSGCHTPFFLYGVQLRLDTKLSLWHANSPEETNAVLNEVNTIHQQVQTTEKGDHYSFFRWWFG